jgi:hypothetical protein
MRWSAKLRVTVSLLKKYHQEKEKIDIFLY